MNRVSESSSLFGKAVVILITLALAAGLQAQETAGAEAGRLTIDHYFELAGVSDPQISPEGDWIAYARLARQDLKEDSWKTRVWMVPATGGEAVAMTVEEDSSGYTPRPRWSPDGKYLAFSVYPKREQVTDLEAVPTGRRGDSADGYGTIRTGFRMVPGFQPHVVAAAGSLTPGTGGEGTGR